MIRIAAFFLLLATSAFAGDRVYADPRCDGPGRYDAMREGADCFNPPACGIVVWETNPRCHEIMVQPDGTFVPLNWPVESSQATCAPGYEQACDARDHGAHPYQPYGGGR